MDKINIQQLHCLFFSSVFFVLPFPFQINFTIIPVAYHQKDLSIQCVIYNKIHQVMYVSGSVSLLQETISLQTLSYFPWHSRLKHLTLFLTS